MRHLIAVLTVLAVGVLAFPTHSAQTVGNPGGDPNALKQFCFMKMDLAAADDNMPVWMNSAYTDVTLVSASCSCVGTCTTEADLIFEVDDGSVAAITGTVDCEDTTTGDTNTAFSGAETNIDQYEVLRFDVNNTPDPATDEYVVCVNYTVLKP